MILVLIVLVDIFIGDCCLSFEFDEVWVIVLVGVLFRIEWGFLDVDWLISVEIFVF